MQLPLSEEGLEKVHAARAARRHRLHVPLEDWSNRDVTSLARLLERLNSATSPPPPSR